MCENPPCGPGGPGIEQGGRTVDDNDDADEDESKEVEAGGGEGGGQPTNSYDPNTGDSLILSLVTVG